MSEEKVALLLLPENIGNSHHILGTLHISKTNKGILLDEHNFSEKELKKHFGTFPKPIKEALASFCVEVIFEIEDVHQQKIKQLLGRFNYRLDTNFAKIDRIQH